MASGQAQQPSGPGGAGPGGPDSNRPPLTGPPYPPQAASLGGTPDILPDIPIAAAFLVLFIAGAAAHMKIFQANRKKSHKFLFSILIFVFSMCRVLTMVLRIAWATRPRNGKLAIAAQIFVAAGTVLLFLINLLFAQRLIRAQHPRLGWHKIFGVFYRLLIAVTILTLIALITTVVQSFYTLDTNIRRIDRIIQLYGTTFFAFVAFLPIPMILLGLVLPKRIRTEKFGKGRFRTKVMILVGATLLLSLGACWRCGSAWSKPVPRTQSPWYLSKACFYGFNFGVEILVIVLYAAVRVDRRFHIPNGARGSYILVPGAGMDLEKHIRNSPPPEPVEGVTLRVYTEEELFDDASTLAETLRFGGTTLELDRMSGQWSLRRQSAQTLHKPTGDVSETSSFIDTRRPSQVYSTTDFAGSFRDNASVYSRTSMSHARSRPVTSSPLAQWETTDVPQIPDLPERLANVGPPSPQRSRAYSAASQTSIGRTMRSNGEQYRSKNDNNWRMSQITSQDLIQEQRNDTMRALEGDWPLPPRSDLRPSPSPRGDSRSDSRGDVRSETRTETRSDTGSDLRGDLRGDVRNDQRVDLRDHLRPDQRTEHAEQTVRLVEPKRSQDSDHTYESYKSARS